MKTISSHHAGLASVTLIEALMIHLLEIGYLAEGDRDAIYEIAIGAHLEAEHIDPDTDHLAIASLLRVLHKRADGVKIVGDVSRRDP